MIYYFKNTIELELIFSSYLKKNAEFLKIGIHVQVNTFVL